MLNAEGKCECLAFTSAFTSAFNIQHSALLPAPARCTARGTIVFFAADPRRQALALVEPHLHANRAVGRECFRKAVVDVGAERLQRQLAVEVPLGARDLGAV